MKATKIIICMYIAITLILLAAPLRTTFADLSRLTSMELNLDVVFAIDTSGSMLKKNSDKMAIETAKMFVALCPGQSSRIGFVTYSSNLECNEVMPLTSISTEDERESVFKSLEDIEFLKKGGTDLSVGLDGALNVIMTAPTVNDGAQRNTFIVVLSDGNNDSSEGSTKKEKTIKQSSLRRK